MNIRPLQLNRKIINILRTFHVSSANCAGFHIEYSPNAKLNKSILDRYLCLPVPECKVQAKYIWIDGTGIQMRSKTRTLDFMPACYKECPNWGFDGNETDQAPLEKSDIWLCPCAMYRDPIRRGNHKLVLCETYLVDHKPTKTNNRMACVNILNRTCSSECMFGFEQEYMFIDRDERPFGWPAVRGQPIVNGAYYCGVGSNNVVGRDIVEAHYRACLYAGVQIFSYNAETAPSEWNFHIGPAFGVKTADDLWMARFLLHRVAEEFGVAVSLHPKLTLNWPGCACHTTMSTKETRADDGLKAIERALCLLEKKHREHMARYDVNGGADNKLRLIGGADTAPYDAFVVGPVRRTSSARIPIPVLENKKGYFEDRRPASNCDPYSVIEMLVKTVVCADVNCEVEPTKK